ncbi:MAG: 5'-nucleotidase C-terminal domain-containing protein [Anaerolineae bacterium]
MKRLFFVILLAMSLAIAVQAQDDVTNITILHSNDTHSWHEANSSGNGGDARMAAVINQIRAEGGNVVLLDAGDRFTGTLFHVQYRGQDNVRIMNAMGYDAMTLGNHEFDNGDEVLANFIDGLEFPVVSSNVDVSESDILAGKVLPYAVLDVNGFQIGVTGLTTPETPLLSSPGPDVHFNADMAAAAQATVDELTAQGVTFVVLVTHIGLDADREVAASTTGIDVIVGGHSHSLLSNTYVGSAAQYPVVVENPNGDPVYIVQAGSTAQYLGRLDVQVNAEGVVTRATGDTIFLSRYITPDPDIEAIVTDLAGPLQELRATEVGATASELLVGDRRVCRVEECTLGDLITDAMINETGAQIAITNGGGIRADIDQGPVTIGDVLTVLPFGNLVSTFSLTGADVVAALENGVSQVQVADGAVVRDGAAGRFPQVAGLRFTWDPTAEAGSRIVSVEVRGADGSFSAIDPAATYTVASNDFMRRGGDGYSVFAENAVNPYDYGKPLDQVLSEYLATVADVGPMNDGRITVVNATIPPLQ